MMLERITLEDYRCFSGVQTAELASSPKGGRNLIPIGGLNGAGKTSLLEAIAFGLLGTKQSFHFLKGLERKGDDLEQQKRELKSLLNHAAFSAGCRTAAVTLELNDENHQVVIRRRWHFAEDGRFESEELNVTLDGKPPTQHEGQTADETYQDYLKQRIPPQVAPFFLFDGEKIQKLADATPDTTVREGIETLLGFDLLDRLGQDLEERARYHRLQNERQNRQTVELDELRSKEEELGRQISQLNNELSALSAKDDELRVQLAQYNAQLDELLGPEKKRPTELQTDLDRDRAEVARVRGLIEEMIDESVVLGLSARLATDLMTRLSGEQIFREWDEGRRRVEPQRDRLITEIFGRKAPRPDPPLLADQSEFLIDRLKEAWIGLFNPPPEGMIAQLRHDQLGAEELDKVRAKWADISDRGVRDLGEMLDRIEVMERRCANLTDQMDRLKDANTEDIDRMLVERDQLNRRIGQAQEGFDTKQRQLVSLQRDLAAARKSRTDKESDANQSGHHGQMATLAQRVRTAVRRYQEELRPRKSEELRGHLRDMYRRLARKEDVVQDIDLDPETYKVRLLNRRGGEIPVHELSAGEKEIFALSLLWSLAKTSKRDLPVVIDTPLGRLDSQHRTNIVTRYLPAAGHQVIVLSTDTELDQRYFALVSDHVARSLHLKFDAKAEKTEIEEGYFEFDR